MTMPSRQDPLRADAARHLRRARAWAADDPDRALEAVSWARCIAPTSLPILRMEIRLLIEIGAPDEVDSLLSRALLFKPHSPPLLELHALRLLQKGRVNAAATLIGRLLQTQPQRAAALSIASDIAEAMGNVDAATSHMEAAVRRDDRSAKRRTRLVELHLRRGDWRAAQRWLNAIPDVNPFLRASVLRASGRFRDAIALLESTLDANCSDLACAEALIDLLSQEGDVESLSRVEQMLHDRSSVRERLHQARLRAGLFEDLSADPAASAHSRCAATAMLGRHDDALAVFARTARHEGSPARSVRTHSAWSAAFIGRLCHDLAMPRASSDAADVTPLSLLMKSAALPIEHRAQHCACGAIDPAAGLRRAA